MIRVDMHVHSTFSDGSCTTQELVRSAARKSVALMALTDHDTIEGLPSFMAACKEYGVRALSGIELSASGEMTVHILGYRFDNTDVLEKALLDVIRSRNERNDEMCHLLQKMGVDVSIDDVRREANGKVVARPHFAAAIVAKGAAASRPEAFARYIGDDGPAYVRRNGLSKTRCVEIIRSAGGLPVLAHPSLTGLAGRELESFLRELMDAGLWGLECLSSHCRPEQSLEYLGIAERLGLFPTAGSDFHGISRPHAHLGVLVTEKFLPWARLGITL